MGMTKRQMVHLPEKEYNITDIRLYGRRNWRHRCPHVSWKEMYHAFADGEVAFELADDVG